VARAAVAKRGHFPRTRLAGPGAILATARSITDGDDLVVTHPETEFYPIYCRLSKGPRLILSIADKTPTTMRRSLEHRRQRTEGT